MIIGEIVLNGVVYSSHRFPESRGSLHCVQRLLRELVYAEDLACLGTVEVRVQNQRGLDRLRSAIWGLNEA